MKSKKLVYTVSTLDQFAIECVELLYKSLLMKNNKEDFDFFVLTNNKNINYDNQNWHIIYDECSNFYVGWLKYSDKLPTGYESYYYFDSDILCYEHLDNMIDDSSVISLMIEKHKMINSWFCYPLCSEEEKLHFHEVDAINAGTFVTKNLQLLKDVRSHCDLFDKSSISPKEHAKFEQSSFNYTIYKNYNSVLFFKLNNLIKLFPDEISTKTIYHFCGFDGNMINKQSKMSIFDKKYRDNLIISFLSKF